MPLYEYACRECDHRFEILQRMGEGPDGLACPRCGTSELAKQYSTFAAAGGTESAGASCAAPACGGGSGFT